jgi:gliding motility-associated-like protein
MTETSVPGACPSSYVLTRTWTATDLCGNPTVASQVITVLDQTAPFANETFDAVVNVNCDAIPAAPALTFGDNCTTVDTPVFAESIINQVPGSYTIVRTWTVTDACGNAGVFTQTVNVTIGNSVTDIPKVSCNEDITVFDLNTFLPAGTPTGGTWVDTENSGGLTGSNFTAFEVPVGNYTLQYQIADPTCPRNININMEVNTDCGELGCLDIVVHNAFSPNGDGLNEFFSIENLQLFECYPNNSVEIYNRWGVMVYDTKQYDNGANSFKGVSEGRATVAKASELPTGTYFYILQYTTSEGQTVKKDGYLYLSR